jgi:hypothetical protein
MVPAVPVLRSVFCFNLILNVCANQGYHTRCKFIQRIVQSRTWKTYIALKVNGAIR